MKNLSENLMPCVAPPWAKGGHAQTLVGYFMPSPKLEAKGERVTVPLDDGDTLVGRYLEGTTDTVIYLFHGLGGSIEAGYMLRTANLCALLGHSVYLMNHRGCGDGMGHAKGPYHSGRAEDLSAVIAFGRARHPERRHLAIGFSLGANALLLLLAGKRGTVLPDMAIAANGPVDLQRTAYLLKRGANRMYDVALHHMCREGIIEKARRGMGKHHPLPRVGSLYDLDAAYTAPEGGFKSREDYYYSCSTKWHLGAIEVPTVLLTAKDDPFIWYGDYVEAARSSSVHLHIEETGGHLGYLTRQKTPLGNHRWLDYALHHFIEALREGGKARGDQKNHSPSEPNRASVNA